MNALASWFLSLWPAHWWEYHYRGDAHLWDTAWFAGPHWFVISGGVLLCCVVGNWTLSTVAFFIHAGIALWYLGESALRLYRIGCHWQIWDLVLLHAVWMNALFAWLHRLNVNIHKPAPAESHTGRS